MVRGEEDEGEGEGDKNRTSMIFWCFNSRRYFTSRIADMSKPSLNWPTFIFFMATFLPVEASLPSTSHHKDKIIGCGQDSRNTCLDRQRHMYPLQLSYLLSYRSVETVTAQLLNAKQKHNTPFPLPLCVGFFYCIHDLFQKWRIEYTGTRFKRARK